MNFSVEFQEPMSYALWPVILVGALLLAAAGYTVARIIIAYIKKRKEERKKLEAEKANEKPVYKPTLDEIKQKYLTELEILENSYKNGEIGDKDTYEKLSLSFRNFVYEATGTPAHKYTLYDIKGLNNPIIYNLVNNYYEPEYSKSNMGNILESLDYTKKVIAQWN